MQKKEIIILSVLAAINFTNIMDFMVMMPLGPQLKRVFSMNPQQWSFMVSSYTFAAFFSGIVSIFFIDRIERKRFLLFSYAGLIVGTTFCALATSYNSLIFARIIAGVFGGVLSSIILAMVGDLVALQHRAKGMGIVMMGFSGAAALGVPLGIYFGAKYDWTMPFVALSIFSTLLWFLCYWIVPAMPKDASIPVTTVFSKVKRVFGDTNKNMSLLFFSLLVFGQFLVIPFLSPFLVSNIGFKEVELINIYLFGGLFTIITSPLIGKYADQFGRSKLFIILAVLSTIPTFFITQLEIQNMPYIIFLSILFFVFIGGRTIPAMSIVLSTAEPDIRGTFMSIRSSFQQFVSGIAAYMSGLIISENVQGQYVHYDWIGYISITCCLLTIPLVRTIREKY
jgi:predicted MFS family arabinose efflux permease